MAGRSRGGGAGRFRRLAASLLVAIAAYLLGALTLLHVAAANLLKREHGAIEDRPSPFARPLGGLPEHDRLRGGQAVRARAGWAWCAVAGLLLLLTTLAGAPAHAQSGICGRTAVVQTVLLEEAGVTNCANVNSTHLAAINKLDLSSSSINALAAGDFAGLTALAELSLGDNDLATLPAGVFANLTALINLNLNGNDLATLRAGDFAGLTTLEYLDLGDNDLATLPAGVFAGLTALSTLYLNNNGLATLPAGVFADLTALENLRLGINPGAGFAPAAVARPDDGEVLVGGGMVMLDGSGSGGAWGANVTYSWELTPPVNGVTFDDAASATPTVTIPALEAGTELTFTLTVIGRGRTGGFSNGFAADPTDTARVSVRVSTGVADQAARVAEAFSYTVPSSTFAGASTTGTLTYRARLANGSALASNTQLAHGRVKPGWLRFDASTRTFWGTPLPGSDGTMSVRVTATDARRKRFSATFDITVSVDAGLVGNFTRPGSASRHLVWFNHGQKFRTGAETAGYTVTSIDMLLRDVHSNTNFPTITINSGATLPGSIAGTLQTPTSGASGGDKTYRYTAPANLALSADTSYWIVIKGGSSSVRKTGWTIIDAGSATGWSIESKTYRSNIRHGGWSQSPNASATSLRINGITTGNRRAVDPPTVTGTPAVSDAGGDGQWGQSETVEVSLTFSEAVEVSTTSGTPDIGISLGLTETRRAAYANGSETDTLVFAYTLGKDDGSHPSMAVTANSLRLNGGSIQSVATDVEAVLKHKGAAVQGNTGGRTPTAPTARFSNLPGIHGGNPFTFGLGFSAEPDELSYRTVGGGLLNVEGGAVTRGVRSTRGSNQDWRVTIAPSGSDDVRIELPNRACGEANALCIRGQALAATMSATIPHHEEVVTLPPLTGSFSGAPTEHDGGEAFELEFRLSEEPRGMSFRTVQNGLFTVTGGSIARAWRLTAGQNREWGLKVTPSGLSAVKLVVNATTDCGQAPGMCTEDGRMLAGGATTTVEGPPTLSVADAEVDEGPDGALEFTVTLNRRVEEEVTVGYRTEDGTASAGLDYTETTGTLSFSAGDISGTVSVPVLDDGHDEGSETMTLRLQSPSPTRVKLADATATGTINNHDPMPKAWMVRFGRTVGSQVVDALGERLEGGSGSHVTVAGINVVGAGPLEAEAEEDDRFGLPAWASQAGLESGTNEINTDDILLRSAFHLSSAGESAGASPAFTAWGRVATGGFETEEDGVTMDGEVTTGLVGFDAEWEQLLAGVMLSQSEGEGSYRLEPDETDHAHSPDSGTVESSLTGVYPYARLDLNARVSAWALAGVGSGELTLHQKRGKSMATDITLRMGAVGVKSQVLDGTGPSKVAMNVKSDAMWVGTKSEDTDELAPTEGDVTRLRFILEGSRAVDLGNGATFTPSAELGLRHDGGDAETGTGIEAGAGLRYSAGGLTVEGRVRGLVAHEAAGYQEWGASGAIRVTPDVSGRGLTLSIAPQWGRTASATGQLWSVRDAAELERDAEFEATGQLAMDAGYGFGLGTRRGVLTPYAGMTLGDGDSRTMRGGARWQLSPDVVVGLEGSRQASDAGEADSEVRLRAAVRF